MTPQIFSKYVLGGMVKTVKSCCGHGDANLSLYTPQYPDPLERVIEVCDEANVAKAFIPVPVFGHRVASSAEGAEMMGFTVYRPLKGADAIVVQKGEAGGFCNADCPMGVLVDPETDELAVIHLALNCLLPQGGSTDVLTNTVQTFRKPASELCLWVGFGIRPCCYGHLPESNSLELARISFPGAVGGLVQTGPRKGAVAIDCIAIVQQIAGRLGGFYQLEIDPVCTACARREDGNHLFFSHVREGGKTKNRNCFLARRV